MDKPRGDVMVRKKPEKPALDPAQFDLDAWLDDDGPQTQTVYLYPRDKEFAARLADLERQSVLAEQVNPEERGMDDPSAEQVSLLVEDLRKEREASGVPITLRALRDAEMAGIGEASAVAKASRAELDLWVLATAIDDERWTVERLKKLATRDRTGEQLVKQMIAAFNEIMEGPSAPFSPAS